MPRRSLVILALLLAALAAAVVLRVNVGPRAESPELAAQFLELRLSRVWVGVLVGWALGVAGVMLQSLLRNPLASPDLLGLGSGAGLGVMVSALVASKVAGTLVPTFAASTLAAVVGAGGALALVYLLSQRKGLIDPISLVLVGVAISLLCAAGGDAIKHTMPDGGVAAGRLLQGTLREGLPTAHLVTLSVIVLLASVAGLASARAMDAAALGEDEARSVGVRLGWLRVVLFASSGVLAACAVVLAGAIGFVGLVCPHVARMTMGPRHGALILGSALCGSTLIVLADALVKSIELGEFGAGRLPLSVVTTFIGAPMLVWLLRQRQRGEA